MKLSCLPVSFFPQIISGEMTPEGWAAQLKPMPLPLGRDFLLSAGSREEKEEP